VINLIETTDTLKVVLGAAKTTNDMPVVVAFYDQTTAAWLPGRSVSMTDGTTPVTIQAAPATDHQRLVDTISIFNADTASKQVTVSLDENGTLRILWRGTLASGESIRYEDGKWTKTASVTGDEVVASIGRGFVNRIPDTQTFTSSGTWTKPTSFTPVLAYAECTGAGGGGGGGSCTAGGSVRMGGSGGGGGSRVAKWLLASDLGSTESVAVGTGGTGGAGGSAPGNSGANGGIGGNSSFGTTPFVKAYGGGGGSKGQGSSTGAAGGGGGGGTGGAGTTGDTTTNGIGGPPGDATTKVTSRAGTGGCGPYSLAGGYAEYGGAGGGGHDATPANKTGGSSLHGGGGGGCGAGHTGTPTLVNAEPGGVSGALSGTGGAAGTSGASPTDGGAGAAGNGRVAGAGGGGGGGSITYGINGRAGGAGGAPGGGGGGGGVGRNDVSSPGGGSGGAGGRGEVRVYTW